MSLAICIFYGKSDESTFNRFERQKKRVFSKENVCCHQRGLTLQIKKKMRHKQLVRLKRGDTCQAFDEHENSVWKIDDVSCAVPSHTLLINYQNDWMAFVNEIVFISFISFVATFVMLFNLTPRVCRQFVCNLRAIKCMHVFFLFVASLRHHEKKRIAKIHVYKLSFCSLTFSCTCI